MEPLANKKKVGSLCYRKWVKSVDKTNSYEINSKNNETFSK